MSVAGAVIRVAIYCRLSRKGGRSLERQEKDGRKIAAEKGWEVAGVFTETVSASEFSKKARLEWERLLEGIEAGDFDAVILWMEDRSNRDLVQAAEFVKVCQEAGLERLVLPGYEYDLTDPEDRNRFYGEVLAAQREVAKMSKRIRRARLEEAEDGKPHPGGKRAFGTQGWRRVADEHGNPVTVRAVPASQAERERALIADAAERVLGGDSLRSIVADWNRDKVPGTMGRGQWTTRSLRRLLLQPRLAGLREHRGTLHKGNGFEPVLPREQWEQVKGVLTDPARMTTAAGAAPRYLLTGLAFCGVCKAKLRGERRDGQVSYRCPGPTEGGHRCVWRAAAPVEELICDTLFRAAETPKLAKLRQPNEDRDPTAALYEALARDQGRLDKLDDDQVLAALDEDHVKAAAVRRVRAEVEARMERTRARARRMQGSQVAAHVPKNLRQVWPDLSLDRQRAILKAVLKLPPEGKGIEIHPQTLRGRGAFDPDAITADWRA